MQIKFSEDSEYCRQDINSLIHYALFKLQHIFIEHCVSVNIFEQFIEYGIQGARNSNESSKWAKYMCVAYII